MKVRIIKDWDHPNFFQQTPGGTGKWGDIEFTDKKVFNCDIVVTLNAPITNTWVYCRNGGRWLMSQEPPHEFYRNQTKSFRYFDKVFTFWQKTDFPEVNIINTQTSLPWHVKKTYDELCQLGVEAVSKKNEVSWITSNLNTRPGHSLRLKFLEFLKTTNFQFHLYGRGFSPIDDKYDGLSPFKYSIAIENFSCDDYWTEKIADCFLSWTMPIYYGCKNITNYFPEKSMILIDPHDPELALLKINDAIKNNRWEQDLKYIKEARELVLNRYQFFPAIAEKIKESGLDRGKSLFFIRKP